MSSIGKPRFNTQPPEGGWLKNQTALPRFFDCFNTQPPEGGWTTGATLKILAAVSTHSRPKAAGKANLFVSRCNIVSTHSRPKAAGCSCAHRQFLGMVSTHSRPKAAGKLK